MLNIPWLTCRKDSVECVGLVFKLLVLAFCVLRDAKSGVKTIQDAAGDFAVHCGCDGRCGR